MRTDNKPFFFSRTARTSALALLCCLTGFNVLSDHKPAYHNIRGARLNNTRTKTWDVAWSEDIHHKRIEGRERKIGFKQLPSGTTISFGNFGYLVYGVDKIDLYLFDLRTKARKLHFWLTVDDKLVSDRSAIDFKGNGNYKLTFALTEPLDTKRVFLIGSCTHDVRFTRALLYNAPEHIFPKALEGVYILKYRNTPKNGKLQQGHPVIAMSGKKEWKLADFAVNNKGIRMPRLGLPVDIRISDAAMGDYIQEVHADNGNIVRKSWRRRDSSRIASIAELSTTRTYLDSRDLDSNNDNHWSPKVLRTMDNKSVPARLAYSTIIPATWFDVPASAQQYRTLKFEYLSEGKKKQASLPLRTDYRNSDGSMRIGFVHYSSYTGGLSGPSVHRVYVVQSCDKGGIIIRRMETLNDYRCLQIVQNTLNVSVEGEAIQPCQGSKVSYYQHFGFYFPALNISEFEAYEYSPICNSGTCRAFRKFLYPPNLIWNDTYVRKMTRENVGYWQNVVDMCQKYSMDFAWESKGVFVADLTVHHPEYAAERFNGKNGTFEVVWGNRGKGGTRSKSDTVDRMNLQAVKRMIEHWQEFFSYFKRLPYVEVAEPEYRHATPENRNFYSKGALDAYRKYVENPNAKFPVRKEWKNTDRTFNTPTEEDLKKWHDWQIDGWTKGQVLSLMDGAYLAFKDNPNFKGCVFLQSGVPSDQGGALRSLHYCEDIQAILEHPALALRVLEHGYFKTKTIIPAREEIAFVKKNNKKIVMLANNIACFGPGEIPASYRKRMPGPMTNWKVPEAYWLVEKHIFGLFPQLDGHCWHANWTEGQIQFWMAYQTVNWNRGLMPLSEARQVMDQVEQTYAKYKDDFDYDMKHVFNKFKIKQMPDDFKVFSADDSELAAIPSVTLTTKKNHFRGPAEGDEFKATIKAATTGKSTLSFLVEVKDSSYTGLSNEKYTFPPGRFPVKDKVDIFLGCSKIPYCWVLGNGGNAGRHLHYIPQNVIWVEARCGERDLVIYHGKAYTGGTSATYRKIAGQGRAEWTYVKEENLWEGRISVNLDAVKKGLELKDLTGFNMGVQDVDLENDDMRYLLYETYPRWINGIARYANVKLVE